MQDLTSQKIEAALIIVRQATARIRALSDFPASGGAGTSLRAVAERLYCERRARDERFPAGLFGEPAWDLMLALFMAREEGRELHLDEAYRAAGVEAGAGRALVTRLEARNMVARAPSKRAKRRQSLHLTKDAVERLADYLAGLI
jgi:DNA-binding MarR family transcriptional regulator